MHVCVFPAHHVADLREALFFLFTRMKVLAAGNVCSRVFTASVPSKPSGNSQCVSTQKGCLNGAMQNPVSSVTVHCGGGVGEEGMEGGELMDPRTPGKKGGGLQLFPIFLELIKNL